MLRRHDDPMLAATAALLAGLEPPEPSAGQAARAVRVALLASAGREKRRGLQVGVGLALLTGALAVSVALGLSRARTEALNPAQASAVAPAPQAGEPSRLRLATGDALTAVEGAEFEVRSALAEQREVKLHDGTMLFDVAPLGSEQHFQVVTPELRVDVVGTVFTVDTRGGRSVVRVYEGHVEVRYQGRTLRLRVGDLFTSDARAPGHDALAGEALAAATRRHARPPAAVEVEVARTAPAATWATSASVDAAGAHATTERHPPPTLNLEQARRLLQRGELTSSLAAADAAIAERAEPLGQWYLLRAQVGARTGRMADAAHDLELAAVYLPGREAHDAAYDAAVLYFEQLQDGARALHVLKASGVVGPDKFVEARGLELRVRLLQSLGRPWEASAVARRYLRAFPDSSAAELMREVADASSASLADARVGG
jgi:hypothetical protein